MARCVVVVVVQGGKGSILKFKYSMRFTWVTKLRTTLDFEFIN